MRFYPLMNLCKTNEKTPPPSPSEEWAGVEIQKPSAKRRDVTVSSEADQKRFWSMVEKKGPNECWEWRGTRNSRNYGIFYFNKTQVIASRTALALSGVTLGDKIGALHTCDNPPCCNPAHLYPGDQKQNNLDAIKRKRYPRDDPNWKPITHCKRGHELTPDNIYINKNHPGMRACITCSKILGRARYLANKNKTQ